MAEEAFEDCSAKPGADVPMVSSPDQSCSGRCGSSPAASSVASVSYRYTERFCTWRKHVRDLYQQMAHLDLVWECPPAQFMPYMTTRGGGWGTQTILSGTRTGGQEQNYVQLLSVTLPISTRQLDQEDRNTFSDATGEVGGYGAAASHAGFRVERRILHDGDVRSARYMPANPLLIATTSSDGGAYIFDWSRVSLNRFPNDPPRPRAPLPPNELTAEATEEERMHFSQRMRSLSAVIAEQDRWDQRTGEAQHVLKLTGGIGVSDCIAWSTTPDGTLASGSQGAISVWQVANMSRDEDREVSPVWRHAVDTDDVTITDVSFSWTDPATFMATTSCGTAVYCDLRVAGVATEVFAIPTGVPAVCLALSPHDGASLLTGGGDGRVYHFDLRCSAQPVEVSQLHNGAVSAVQWCPHSHHVFASGGEDGLCTIYNTSTDTLLFKHSAHSELITDIDWSWQECFAGQLLTADPNAITVWRPRDMFWVA